MPVFSAEPAEEEKKYTEYTNAELDSFIPGDTSNMYLIEEFTWQIREVEDITKYKSYIVANLGQDYYDFIEAFYHLRNFGHNDPTAPLKDVQLQYFPTLLEYYIAHREVFEEEMENHFYVKNMPDEKETFYEGWIKDWMDSIIYEFSFEPEFFNLVVDEYEFLFANDYKIVEDKDGNRVLNALEPEDIQNKADDKWIINTYPKPEDFDPADPNEKNIIIFTEAGTGAIGTGATAPGLNAEAENTNETSVETATVNAESQNNNVYYILLIILAVSFVALLGFFIKESKN